MSYIYIKRNLKGFYYDTVEPLDPENFNNLGETWEDYLAGKWVLLNEKQVAFKKDNPSAKVWEVYKMELDPVIEHVRTVEEARDEMLDNIRSFDQSDGVNSFIVNNTFSAWFTIEERLNYQRSIDAALAINPDMDLIFFIGDVELSIKPQTASLMLSQIQLYADTCYVVTKRHKLAVENMATIEEIDNYDYTMGYPEKLNFEL